MAVYLGLFRVPRCKNLQNGFPQLNKGIVSHINPLFRHPPFVGKCNSLHLIRLELYLLFHIILGFKTIHDIVKKISFQTLIHPPGLQKSTIRIPSCPLMSPPPSKSLSNILVNSHVEERIHHPRQGYGCSAPDREKQRVTGISKSGSHYLLKFSNFTVNPDCQVLENILITHNSIISSKYLSSQDKTRWNAEPKRSELF